MTNKTRVTLGFGVLLLTLLIAACTPDTTVPTEPPQISTPTTDPIAITQTYQAIVTAAQATLVAGLTAEAPPTSTAAPTSTPIVITATVVETAATQPATTAPPVATSAPGQQVTSTITVLTVTPVLTTCQIVSQSPAFGQDFAPREDLDLVWRVRNTSSQAWNQAEVDYVFVSGTDFHRQAAYDFRETVQPNGEVNIIVDVMAPSQPGRYSATWAIVRGGQQVCLMSATIDVVE